ncbi:hypothetical protein EV189_1307 [Motilibacter rhizosphaerae]|uniref:Uncharacterized protein n=1 Tax=Motilibacter rhizosphaerae TaxID=598652 RepID=A0A4Q7NRR9_9ACTN|nr:hypothetical protein [Motilibacter rhizosphaerae]RZS89540.1 hypothetical protein EV189_1307 [Motilibacter rhizosphaerae]
MIVDCDTCSVRGRGCADCVVPLLLGTAPPELEVPVDLDADERRALRVLAEGGLVPPLRHVRSA